MWGENTLLKGKNILVVEDETFVAFDIALAIEDTGGTVIGPAASVEEALQLLSKIEVSGAILDVNLTDRDVTPVALLLIEQNVPLIFHTGVGVPAELAAIHPNLVICIKPTSPERLIEQLRKQMDAR